MQLNESLIRSVVAQVLAEVSRGGITSCTTYLDLAHTFPMYGLPMSLEPPARTHGHE